MIIVNHEVMIIYKSIIKTFLFYLELTVIVTIIVILNNTAFVI